MNRKRKLSAAPRAIFRAPFSSYRAICWKSTRIILASLAGVCILISPALSGDKKSVFLPGPSGAYDNPLPARALESSPSLYLRQAASSAIRWQPYDAHAFVLARSLHRPILIDLGAVWCHWCHVMDQTTYADLAVAAMLNRDFVPVKVDTDERPDIDDYYQNAAAHLTGAAGWPLTCFTTNVATVGLAAEYRAYGYADVVIVGPPTDRRTDALWHTALATYRPAKNVTRISNRAAAKSRPAAARAMLTASAAQHAPLAFVCAGTVCANPVDDPAKLADLIKRFAAAGSLP